MQTSYNEAMAVAVAGMLVDDTNRRIESMFAENAFDPGEAVQLGSSDNQAETVAASVYGVAINNPTAEMDAGSAGQVYAQYDSMSVLTAGRIWVAVDGAVAKDAQAYWDVAAGAFNATSTDNIIVTGGTFKTTTTGAGLAILEIK